jgi:hypothetical protein
MSKRDEDDRLKSKKDQPSELGDGDGGALSDDDRVQREDRPQQQGARVEPGPADKARLPKP